MTTTHRASDWMRLANTQPIRKPPQRRWTFKHLTEEQIEQARLMFAEGVLRQEEIARRLGVCGSTMMLLRRRRGWAWTKPPRAKRGRNPRRTKPSNPAKRALVRKAKMLLVDYTPLEVVAMTGLSRSVVYNIRSGKYWRDVSIAIETC